MKKPAKILKILSLCIAAALTAAVISGYLLLEPAVRIHEFDNLNTNKLKGIQRTIQVYDGGQSLVTDSLIINNKIYVRFGDLAQHTVDAFVSIEDTRFFEHSGIDYYRIVGSTFKNIKNKSFKEGASTITQQLVKNTHLTGEKKIKRKLNEMRIAVDLERHYSKNEILEMYLNAIYFGNNIYGIGAAAKTYFGKPAAALSLNESAMLAAIINNPSRYNPATNPKPANQRRRLVLSQMRKNKKITEGEYLACVNSDILIENVFFDQYANFLISEACEVLSISRSEFLSRNYIINTYLDAVLQSKINSLLKEYQFGGKNNSLNGSSIKDNVYIQAVVMTTQGEIIANACNTNQNLSEVYRQPGSVIKPAIAYAPAFEKKLAVPITPILDEPVSFSGYSPKNFRNKSLGWISVSDSLIFSQNIPAIKLMEMSGIEYSKTIASLLGYEFVNGDDHLALALGGMTKGAKLTQIANSYQAFANGGRFIKGGHIESILDGGDIIFETRQSDNSQSSSGLNDDGISSDVESDIIGNGVININTDKTSSGQTVYKRSNLWRRAVSEETAYFINAILTKCAKDGTARRIGGTAAAKTGTVGNENGNTDAFTVVYNDKYIIAVWIGAKNGVLPNTVNGSTHPCIIAKNILNYLPPADGFTKPDGVIEIELDKSEYNKNHKLIHATDNAYAKDKIKGEFLRSHPPVKKVLDNKFIMQMNDIDIKNFIILE